MSTIKVNSIKNTSTDDGGIAIDNSGHVQVDGQQLPTTGALSNRNLIINGAHIVWQRQTSVSGGSVLDNFAYATDRFWLYAPSSTSGTVGQSTDAPSGFIYSTHNNLDSSCTIGTNVELLKQGSDAPFVNGESLTFSFYIKSTSARTGVALTITTRDNAGGAGSVTRATGVTFDSTTSWTRVEKTFTLSNTIGSNNRCLQIEFSLAIGDKVTGFQLEKGDKATPFEHRSYSDELLRCYRYYYKLNQANGAMFGPAVKYNATVALGIIEFPVHMRANVTAIEQSGTASHYGVIGATSTATCTSVPSYGGDASNKLMNVNFSVSSGTFSTGQAVLFRSRDNDAFLAFSAEL